MVMMQQRVAGLVVVCGLLSGCAVSLGSGEAEGDGPVYESITSLAEASDAVLIVEVGEVVSTEFDNGGDDTDGDAGVPMSFWDATVTATVVPAALEREGDHIVIGWPDLSEANTQGRSSLTHGQRLILFASRLTSSDAPGIDTQDVFYIPVGGDNGVLDVNGREATARAESLVRLEPSSETADGRLTVGLVTLKRTVRDSR